MMKTCSVIMHSQHESGGLVVLESLAAGVPVIATDTGFAGDIIEDWHAGFKVNFADTDILASRMELFVKHPLLSRCMGIAAADLYADLQRKWRPFQKMVDVYECLIEKNHDICFDDTEPQSGKIIFPDCRLNEEAPLDMQRDWIIQALNASLNTDNPIEYMEFMKEKPSANDIWRVKIQDNTYIAKRLCSVLNPLKFLSDDEPSGFHSSNRFSDCIISMKSNSILQSVTDSEVSKMIVMPEVTMSNPSYIESLYESISLLKVFHADVQALNKDMISSKPVISQRNLIEVLCDKNTYPGRAFVNRYEEELLYLRSYLDALAMEENLGIIYGKSAIRHLVYDNDDKKYLLPSADIRFGEQGLDYALLVADYLLNTNTSKIIDGNNIIAKCINLTGISPRSFYTSLGIITALRIKMEYVIYGCLRTARSDILLENTLNML